jgi:hypothetical protein
MIKSSILNEHGPRKKMIFENKSPETGKFFPQTRRCLFIMSRLFSPVFWYQAPHILALRAPSRQPVKPTGDAARGSARCISGAGSRGCCALERFWSKKRS